MEPRGGGVQGTKREGRRAFKRAKMFECRTRSDEAEGSLPPNGLGHKWVGILLGRTGDFIPTKEKIANAFTIKDCFVKALEQNPSDPTLYHCLGQWCYTVASVSWLEKKAASLLFATPKADWIVFLCENSRLGALCLSSCLNRPEPSWDPSLVHTRAKAAEKNDAPDKGHTRGETPGKTTLMSHKFSGFMLKPVEACTFAPSVLVGVHQSATIMSKRITGNLILVPPPPWSPVV